MIAVQLNRGRLKADEYNNPRHTGSKLVLVANFILRHDVDETSGRGYITKFRAA
jgi:hypothetical protein